MNHAGNAAMTRRLMIAPLSMAFGAAHRASSNESASKRFVVDGWVPDSYREKWDSLDDAERIAWMRSEFITPWHFIKGIESPSEEVRRLAIYQQARVNDLIVNTVARNHFQYLPIDESTSYRELVELIKRVRPEWGISPA